MRRQILLVIGLATLLTPVMQASQEQLATSIKEARLEAGRTSDQLKATLDALTALTKQKEGDLQPAFKAFTAEAAKTETAANWTRTRVDWMAGDGQEYFTGWQKTIDGIANESLRKKAQKRLDTVRKSYDKVGASLKNGAEAFKPFLSDLADIQKALSKDVTPGGVKAVKGVVRDANWRYESVSFAITSALKEMQKMEKALSSEVK
jgi:hypothetical protein